MERIEGATAVVTGGASGIGRALAGRFASAGARVVLADIEVDALERAAKELEADGAQVLAVPTDVSKAQDVEALAAAARGAFGPVHILCNNAGVGAGGPIDELTLGDWQWVLGVNLFGVIHGLSAFLPGMLAHGEQGHIVNTASLAGLYSAPWLAPYSASKFGVVAISESLHQELAMRGASIGVSVLCPGWVDTRIHESERNRPAALRGPDEGEPRFEGLLAQVLASGMDPAEVAAHVEAAVLANRLYVITHPEMLPIVETRMRAILDAAGQGTPA